MVAIFPAYARLLLDGYGEEPDYGVLRTDMDGGLAKQRPRWNKAIVTRDANILVMNRSAKVEFDEWVRVDINGGASWFDYPDPVAGVTKQARIVGGKYKWSTPGVLWIAACQVETIG